MNQTNASKTKVFIAPIGDFPEEGGTCAKIGEEQIAIFRFASRNEWFACENACPHTKDMVLSRGLVGDFQGEPKVACPMHKRNFSLLTGECMNGEDYKVKLYSVIVEEGKVYLELEQID
ncbi:nitrite reductase small subunit NirD [Leptospira wolffii]|uniref:nitrite reductase small subunit NirD n=1 Tax=Leptospira wolffii TaxID=409998 RepID=UPI0010844D19|nr:nitrite reductase small subunit NirD [Leptospira wolffii]TGK54806.1 nitrite reductase small subunit NirD [Leptospira wolffii]TGK65706.1 nitrite reductase small subunit NirD [Leptospira wolffii]TGK70728.1 nitrite reductase small subunit NirD [Leptospira wolffii]TGL26463.1 nitrite reductase small subunit NirD [Leptospira wolffii]